MRTETEEEAGRHRPLFTHAEHHYRNINSNYETWFYNKAAKNIRNQRRDVRQTLTLQSAPTIQQKKKKKNGASIQKPNL